MAAVSVSSASSSNESFHSDKNTVTRQSSNPELERPNPWKKKEVVPPEPADKAKDPPPAVAPPKEDGDAKPEKGEKEPKEPVVKKFDNKTYVEAPLPKTNPWNKGKKGSAQSAAPTSPAPVAKAPVVKPGTVMKYKVLFMISLISGLHQLIRKKRIHLSIIFCVIRFENFGQLLGSWYLHKLLHKVPVLAGLSVNIEVELEGMKD